MSNYNKATNFAVKDTLITGDPDKVVSGVEIDNEFNSIASAVTSKVDKVAGATTDNFAALDANGNLKDSNTAQTTIIQLASPPGSVTAYAGLTAPTGWLLCSGQAVSRSANSDLFSAIGTTFGAGDGSTTFNVPDLRDRFPLGNNSQGASDAGRVNNFSTNTGSTGGSDEHQLTEAEMPSHNHRFFDGGFGNNIESVAVDAGGNGNNTNTHFTRNTGEDQPHNNMPPFLALNYIIKT